jgi:hypothetical protein
MTGNDRKLQVALEQNLQEQLGSPNADRLCASPFGPLTDRLSRQTLIYLITTLNCAFPYYDFSYVSGSKDGAGLENPPVFSLGGLLDFSTNSVARSLLPFHGAIWSRFHCVLTDKCIFFDFTCRMTTQ